MIDFFDGEIIDMNLEGASRSGMLSWFFTNHYQNVCIRAFQNDEFVGYIMYHDVLFSTEDDLSECLWTKQIQIGQNIFEECEKVFADKETHSCYIPVFYKDSIVGFAYKSSIYDRELIDCFSNLNFEQKKELIQNLCPNAKQWVVEGFNSISYSIVKILKEIGIDYQLFGEYWEYVGEKSRISQISVPRYQVACLAEDLTLSVGRDITDTLFFERKREDVIELLFKTIHAMQTSRINKLMKFAEEKGLQAYNVFVPADIPLSEYEKHIRNEGIHLDAYVDVYNDNTKQDFENLYGEDLINNYLQGNTREQRHYITMNTSPIFYLTDEIRKNRVFLIGPCIVGQQDMMTNDTIASHLQKHFDEIYPENYSVVCVMAFRGLFSAYDEFSHLWDINENDIIISFFDEKANNADCIDISELWGQRGKELWFADKPIHVTAKGSKKVAEYLIERIIKKGPDVSSQPNTVSYADRLLEDEQEKVKKYVEQYQNEVPEKGVIGAIVMNCNPYTRGHDYLVKQALKQVDFLVIFVVEEDQSEIPFIDRFNMVFNNTKKYENVLVIPSGEMIISQTSFEAYFHKAELQEAAIDASKDLRIFSLGIAPAFHISKRFVGQEPIDKVTNQYNQEMKKVLQHYGIEVVEIPRLENENGVISASEVRKIMKGSIDWEEKLHSYVTEETLCYLKGIDG